MISNLVRAFSVPMHLGLKNRSFVPHNLIAVQGSPVPSLNLRTTPRLILLMSPGSTKKKPKHQVWLKPKLHTHRECGQRFHPLHHSSYTVDSWLAPLCEDVFSSKKAHWNPGLCPISKQKSGLCIRTEAHNQFSVPSLCTTKTSPPCPLLNIQPEFYLSSYILPLYSA